MKQVYCLIAILVIICASCKKDAFSHITDYMSSYATWSTFKDSSHNSYRYRVDQSSWSGYRGETVITVKAGKVVGRSFIARQYNYNGTTIVITVTGQWTEAENQLSTHEDGAPPVTLDAIYKEVKENWLLKRDDVSIYFENKNRGMISSCGYVPDGCQDDCFRGITIGFIEGI